LTHCLLWIIYLSFISLGLPDSLLGSAWPAMYPVLGAPVSAAGVISMLISAFIAVSSLCSDRMTRRFGAGRVNAASCALTATALYGFSCSTSFWQLCVLAVPYGLGAGGVDAALNNYVAVHYDSRHMSWLHCMWGIGSSAGPYIMSCALMGSGWESGYRQVAVIQMLLTSVLLLSLPLWKRGDSKEAVPTKSLTLRETLAIPGAKSAAAYFFCYCGLEQTVVLWGSSYLVLRGGLSEESAAGFAALFVTGLTVGRGACGFAAVRFSDVQMMGIGLTVAAAGLLCLLLPLGEVVTLMGLIITGVGCAPLYPSAIHATPSRFGAVHSQALIGIQMASASIGCVVLPPLFGAASRYLSLGLFPWYLAGLLAAMVIVNRRIACQCDY